MNDADPEQHKDPRVLLREALKRTAVAFKQSGIPFALGGSYAGWARGGPEPSHDVDFVVAAQDAHRASVALTEAGLDVRHPPEDWLFKIYTDESMVDVLFRLGGQAVEPSVLERATEVEVLSVTMPVLSATDVVAAKLAALNEHMCDLSRVLPLLRALREQVDWQRVRSGAIGNPFAEAALFLCDRLGLDQDAEDNTGRLPSSASKGRQKSGMDDGQTIAGVDGGDRVVGHQGVSPGGHEALPGKA